MAKNEQATVQNGNLFSLNEVRERKTIRIQLPLSLNENGEKVVQQEIVTVNGKNTAIKRGEPVDVSWSVFEALYNSKRYEGQNILA